MEYLYILRCQHGCYYIGKTADPTARLESHRKGKGASWTRFHPPVGYELLLPLESPLQEDAMTEEWMLKKGIDKVRGGMYCQINLPATTMSLLEKKLNHAAGLCLKCGEPGHLAAFCRKKQASGGCRRCGRASHDQSRCYAKTHQNGGPVLTDPDLEADLEDNNDWRPFSEVPDQEFHGSTKKKKKKKKKEAPIWKKARELRLRLMGMRNTIRVLQEEVNRSRARAARLQGNCRRPAFY